VAPGVAIPMRELTWRFSTSGGPGGQHVNTSNTRAEVSFDIAGSPSLPDWARERLLGRLGPGVTVAASDRRSQARNRELALARLAARLGAALEVAPARRPTRPTLASRQRRVEAKRRRGGLKRERRAGRRAGDDDGG
jgi:ribosome-associated protein